MRKNIMLWLMLSVVVLSVFISGDVVDVFENVTPVLVMEFYDPEEDFENSSFINMPAFKCAYDSRMNISGEFLSGTNDSAFEVVLVNDLSDSMENCLHNLYYNLSIPKSECYAFTDRFGEGTHDQKWNTYVYNLPWNVVYDDTINSAVLYQSYAYSRIGSTMTLLEIAHLTFRQFHARFDAAMWTWLSNPSIAFHFGRPMASRLSHYDIGGAYTVRITESRWVQLYYGRELVEEVMMTGNPRNWNRYEVFATDTEIRVIVNGDELIAYAHSEPMKDGYISFSPTRTRMYLDNVYVFSLDHNYTCTEEYGYASWVTAKGYLAENITWSPLVEGICHDWQDVDPSVGCEGLPLCHETCSSWSYSYSSCHGNPLCSTHYRDMNSGFVCNSGTPCCSNPSSCYPTYDRVRTESENIGYRPSCTNAEFSSNYLRSCRTRNVAGDYCPGGRSSPVVGSCPAMIDAYCVEDWCSSNPESNPGSTCRTSSNWYASSRTAECRGNPAPSSASDSSTVTSCGYGSCNDPNIECRVRFIPRGTGLCSGYSNNYNSACMQFGGESTPWYYFEKSWNRYQQTYQYCPDPYYYWIGTQVIPQNLRYQYCTPGNVIHRYCANMTGEYATRSDFMSTQFDDSRWGDLYDYIPSLTDYIYMHDGDNYHWTDPRYNYWECRNCARFYRKEFELRNNVAFQKPVDMVYGSCSSRSRITDGLNWDNLYSECWSGVKGFDVDLGALVNVTGVNVIMGLANPPRMYDISVELSGSSDFSGDTLLVWNYSSDGRIPGVPEGFFIPLASPYEARYARLVMWARSGTPNQIIELEVFEDMAVEDITDAVLHLNHAAGIMCYLNGRFLYLNNSVHQTTRGWRDRMFIDPDWFVDGTNLLACQVKADYVRMGFNAMLQVNENSRPIHYASDWKFVQQEVLCGGQRDHFRGNSDSNPSYEGWPGMNTCEYVREVESCEGYHPLSITAPQDLVVSGWTMRTDSHDFFNGFELVITPLASFLGGTIGVLNYNPSNRLSDVDPAIWDADIIIFDGDDTVSYTNAEVRHLIGSALAEGKTVITEWDRVQAYRSDSRFSFSAVRDAWSYDLFAQAWQVRYDNGTHSGVGTLVADQNNRLAVNWRQQYRLRNWNKHNKAANLLDAIYPIWDFSDRLSGPVPTDSACWQFGRYHGAEICEGIRIKLAHLNTEMFLDMTVGMGYEGVKVGAVAFGSGTDSCRPPVDLTDDASLLYAHVDSYRADCGHTCVSCGLRRAIEMFEDGSFLNNGIEDDIVLMTDGMANRIIGSSSDVSFDVAGDEALWWACDLANPRSAASLNITIHSIYYGAADSEEAVLAMLLSRNISTCTGGVFLSAADPESLREAYLIILGLLGSGFPDPKIRFGDDGSLPWDWEWTGLLPLMEEVVWRNRSCEGADCVNLMTALNREVLGCIQDDYAGYAVSGCDVRMNVSTNQSGRLIFHDLSIDLVDASVDPIAFPYPVDPSFSVDVCPIDNIQCGNGVWDSQFGEECENSTHCGAGGFCIPPGRAGECTCLSGGSGCGNGVLDAGENCDDVALFDDFSCYPPGSRIDNYPVGCRWRTAADICGNGMIDAGEECDPSAPAPFGDDACPGGYRCVPPGSDFSCTCVRNSWNVGVVGGGFLNLTIYQGGRLSDIDLLNHGVSPVFPRENLSWSVSASSNPTLVNFTVTDKILDFDIGNGYGNASVTVTVRDMVGRTHSFIINVEIREFTPRPALDIDSSLIMTSHKIVNEFYEDKNTGFMKEFGPYTITMKVYVKNE